MTRKAVAALVLTGVALTACQQTIGTRYEAVDRTNVEFVQLQSNVRFAGQAYARGETFEVVRLSGGQKIVIMQRVARRDDLLVSVVGPLISTSSSWGAVLDGNNCTIGQGASVQGAGSPSEGRAIAVFEGYSPEDPQPIFETGPVFCFDSV